MITNKLVGIKKVAEETKELTYYGNWHLQLGYNLDTGELCTHTLVGQSELRYKDECWIQIGKIREPMTMAAIRQMVENRLIEYNYIIKND